MNFWNAGVILQWDVDLFEGILQEFVLICFDGEMGVRCV